MKELYKRINLILANWNPLSIPKNIAEVEYLHYIPIIISLCNSKKKLESYLIKINLEMGLPRNKRLLKEISRIVNDIIKESLEQKKKSAAMSDLNRLVYASGKVKQASYSMQMTFGRMSEPLTKVQKVDSTKTAQSYDFTYKYEDSNHPTAPTQIGHEHYTYDANGNPTLVENDSLGTERRMYWDEDNRLMVLSDNGKTSRYTYNAAGERIIKSHGDLEGVYINGAPQGITFHETEDYTIYPAPIITVTKNRFTKHYFIGDKRVASKLGVGKFSNVYGISGNNVTAGQKDYAARMMQTEKQREEYYKSLGTPPGVPTMKGATADPDNTGRGYNDIIGDLGDHSVPEGWVQRPKFNEKGDVPGPPIQWQKPEDPDNAQPGYGYVPADTTNTEDIFFYHSDHLGSTSYITDVKTNITQFDAYLPYGELLVDEHSCSEDMPYKFNGKELDQETGLYYYGARYMNSVTSLWYGVDPLAEKYPSVGGYVYCMENPTKLIDPNGKETHVALNKDGTYRVVGGILNKDRNIYIFDKDKYGKYTIKGKFIGVTSSTTSFYNSVYNKGKGTWAIGATINPKDRSGKDFLNKMISKDITLDDYIDKARNNRPYDFKVTNGSETVVLTDLKYVYRGMSIGKTAFGQEIYTSARDIGNIAAGIVAAKNGIPWEDARIAFDVYQGGREGISTQNAEYYGWSQTYTHINGITEMSNLT